MEEDDLLARVAAAEALSEHPLAGAITDAAKARGLALPPAAGLTAVAGKGLTAQVDGARIAIGNARLMQDEGVDLAPFETVISEFGSAAQTPVLAAIDGRAAGALAVADPIRPGAKALITGLRRMGVATAMISGDVSPVAEAVAGALGIDAVRAETLPADKVKALKSLTNDKPAAFVGDGINDAPALAAAEVGIAIGTGTDVAIESADVVLMSGDPRGVLAAITLSRATMANIRQNLGWAFGYNVLLIPVAAGALYPSFGLLLSPVLAAGAMALSSVLVLSNALRLRFVAAPKEEE